MMGTLECPCGGCLPCRINRRRVWALRICLESFKHRDSCFVTLTYDDGHVPSELVKSHYQGFLKRLRKAVAPRKIRFFLAGEYGELSGRPHFHLAIFGLDRYTAGGHDGRGGVVQDCWYVGRLPDGTVDKTSLGFTFVGSLTWESASYVAGYLTKKVVNNEKAIREFSRMSLRPGIGASAMVDVARSLGSDVGLDSVAAYGDVPSVLRYGGKLLPLGRYLRRELRGALGFASKDTPPGAARLQGLRAAAEVAEARYRARAAGLKPWEAEKLILDMRMQNIYNRESRFKIRDSKRSLK